MKKESLPNFWIYIDERCRDTLLPLDSLDIQFSRQENWNHGCHINLGQSFDNSFICGSMFIHWIPFLNLYLTHLYLTHLSKDKARRVFLIILISDTDTLIQNIYCWSSTVRRPVYHFSSTLYSSYTWVYWAHFQEIKNHM